MNFECNQCGSHDLEIRDKANNHMLYCNNCGSFIKNLNKSDYALALKQIQDKVTQQQMVSMSVNNSTDMLICDPYMNSRMTNIIGENMILRKPKFEQKIIFSTEKIFEDFVNKVTQIMNETNGVVTVNYISINIAVILISN